MVSVRRLVDMFVFAPLGHIILTKQFLLLLVNAACLWREATNTNFRVFGLTRPGSTHDLQHIFAVSTLTITPPPLFSYQARKVSVAITTLSKQNTTLSKQNTTLSK
jgi:hypothetical protein